MHWNRDHFEPASVKQCAAQVIMCTVSCSFVQYELELSNMVDVILMAAWYSPAISLA